MCSLVLKAGRLAADALAMRAPDWRTPMLGLGLWGGMAALSAVTWLATWPFVRWLGAVADPVRLATLAGPAGAALAVLGLAMAARALARPGAPPVTRRP